VADQVEGVQGVRIPLKVIFYHVFFLKISIFAYCEEVQPPKMAHPLLKTILDSPLRRINWAL